MKELPPRQEQRRFEDQFPLRVSLQEQQTGDQIERKVSKGRGIRKVDPITAQRRYAKFIRDLR